MSSLSDERCIPCERGAKQLPAGEVARLYADLGGGWRLENGKLVREFRFRDFKGSMEFLNRVAAIAEKEWHHPDIYIFFNLVRLELSTHSIGGLSKNDFIMAAKINAVPLLPV